MQRKHDPEPERYYDWMLWKMRQERVMEDPVDDVTTHNKLTEWTRRSKPVVMTTEQMYQRDIAEMQAQVHTLQIRVKELTDALLQLQEQRDR
tara:strand:+ start:1624 stop:1899 length:276 start_codon:yes stop_codon:yes gene_type:complete